MKQRKTKPSIVFIPEKDLKMYSKVFKSSPYMVLRNRAIGIFYNKWEGQLLYNRLYNDFAKEYKLKAHPKFDRLFRLAFEYGQQEGVYKVLIYFNEMLDLIL